MFKNNCCEPVFGLEILYKINENYPEILKKYWGEEIVREPAKWFEAACKKALEVGAKIVFFTVNIEDEDELEAARAMLEKIVKIADKFEIIFALKGTGQKDLDARLLSGLMPLLKKSSIIAPVQDGNYAEIIKAALDSTTGETRHNLVLRTPIDINLTKELNILSIDEGLESKNILIDPDMGCIGYGLDYGYSIIERIVCAKADDEMLNMPIIVFAGLESFKAKEAKSEDFSTSWGDIETRSVAWEIATTTALICAGADIAIVWHPETIVILKEVL